MRAVGDAPVQPRPPALGRLSGRRAGCRPAAVDRAAAQRRVWRSGATARSIDRRDPRLVRPACGSSPSSRPTRSRPASAASTCCRSTRPWRCCSAGGRRSWCSGRAPSRWLRVGLLACSAGCSACSRRCSPLLAAAQAVGVPLLDSAAALSRPAHRRRRSTRRRRRRAAQARSGHLPRRSPRPPPSLWPAAATVRRWGVALACDGRVHRRRHRRRAHDHPAGHRRGLHAAAVRRGAAPCGRRPEPSCTRPRGLDYGTLFYWGAAMPGYDRERDAEPPPYLLLPESAWLQISRRAAALSAHPRPQHPAREQSGLRRRAPAQRTGNSSGRTVTADLGAFPNVAARGCSGGTGGRPPLPPATTTGNTIPTGTLRSTVRLDIAAVVAGLVPAPHCSRRRLSTTQSRRAHCDSPFVSPGR